MQGFGEQFSLPAFPAAAAADYSCGDGARMLLLPGTQEADARAYVRTLVTAGFAQADEDAAPGSYCALLRREGLTVSVNYFDGETRLIADPFTAETLPDDPCARTAQTTLWQHEVDHTLIDCGMCFIIRCCDGSFFLVDSGHYFQVNDNDRIHRFLRSRTPAGEKIRIAGWYLTHAHSDHVCKFSDFLHYNMDDCQIDAVYYNFPDPFPGDGAGWRAGGNSLLALTIGEQLAQHPEMKKVKLHTGQHFAVRNLRFTVLCTHEDAFPTESDDFNNTSTVLMMEAEGSRVLFCGDAGERESDIMTRRWGEALRCDILQVAHHGHHGCSAAFYDLARGKAALFSNTQIFFDLDLIREKEANETILRHAKEYYISSNGTVEANLPYDHFTCFPDETFEDFEKIQQLWGYTYSPEYKEKLYREYLARGGRRAHAFYHDPNEENWHDT